MNDLRFAYRQLMKQLCPASVNSAVIDKLRGPGFWAAHRVPFTMLSGVPPRQASPRKLPRLPAGPRASPRQPIGEGLDARFGELGRRCRDDCFSQ